MQLSCMYSTMSAYEQILNDETLAPMRTVLYRLNLNNYLEPNLIYDKQRTETARNDLLSGISQASGMVMAGQKIISTGDIITEQNARMLYSFEKENARRQASSKQITNHLIGSTIYVLILVSLFTFYLYLFRRDYFDKPRNIMMIYTWLTIFPYSSH